jgi:hypothetical protein
MTDARALPIRGTRSYQLELLVGAAVISLVYLVYVSFWWNRYCMPVLEWFPFYARQMRDGKFVYRDFYFFLPPLHLIELAWIQRLFGEALWVPRVAGILQRLGIALTVLVWLSRSYPVGDVVPAVIVGTMVSESSIVFGLFNYWDGSILYGVLMGLFASLSLEGRPEGRYGPAFLAGWFGGLASLTKQTMGPLTTATACLAIAFVVWRRAGLRPAAILVAMFSFGWWVPFGLTLAWLAGHGALANYVRQVYVTGPSSKGSLGTILARPVHLFDHWARFMTPEWLITTFARGPWQQAALVVALIGAIVVAWRGRVVRRVTTAPAPSLPLAAAALVLFMIYVAQIIISRYVARPNNFLPAYIFSPMNFPSGALNVVSWLALLSVVYCALSIPLSAYRFWKGPSRADLSFRLVFSAVAFGLYYSSSLSMGAQSYEPIGSTAVALMMVDFAGVSLSMAPDASRVLLGSLAVITCFGVTCVRLESPTMWVGWTERPVNEAVYRSRHPLLTGLRLSRDTVGCLDRITAIVQKHSNPGDPIFAYPSLPLFYYLARRSPPTFAYVDYYDVCPDQLAREEAARLLEKPPAVLIEMVFPPEVEKSHEDLFRGDKASGQRDLRAAIRKLTDGYALAATLDGASYQHGGQHYPIKVWVRPPPDGTASARGADLP